MLKKITYFIVGLAAAGVMLSLGREVYASTLIINNIEVTNFLPQTGPLYSGYDTFNVNTADMFSIDFAPDAESFQIIILQSPYEENRMLAEQTFVEKLGVTRSEACYLNVSIVAPAFVTDQPDSKKLLLCEPDKQADVNGDGGINTFDYAICLDEMVQDPTKIKMHCDLNVNRRIDAADLSRVISYFKKR